MTKFVWRNNFHKKYIKTKIPAETFTTVLYIMANKGHVLPEQIKLGYKRRETEHLP